MEMNQYKIYSLILNALDISYKVRVMFLNQHEQGSGVSKEHAYIEWEVLEVRQTYSSYAYVNPSLNSRSTGFL